MIKLIGTAYRRDDFTSEQFYRYWREVHAPISADAPGLRGYVVSEVVRKLQGDLEADAFVEQWWDDEAAFQAWSATPDAAAAWADVANYARTDGTFWFTREHVQLTPAYVGDGLLRGGPGQPEGRLKAIGTAYRRDDFTMEAFIRYWNDVHAPISARAAGLRGYVVSEVVSKLGGAIESDAFVEQWWDDEESLDLASASVEVAAAWADVANYARLDGTFWITREHVLVTPPYAGPGLLEQP